MKLVVVIAIVALSHMFCGVARATPNSFEGVFTDHSVAVGMSTICCQRGQTIFCSYSQTGIQFGTLSNNGRRLKGEFFDVGYGSIPPVQCQHGLFDITLTSDGNGFKGTYQCDGFGEQPYEETRIPGTQSVPRGQDCAALDLNGTLNGHYQSRDGYDYNFYYCSNPTDYNNSYSFAYNNNRYLGYDLGTSYYNGVIGTGYYVECDGGGYELNFLLEDGTFGQYYYNFPRRELSHGTIYLERIGDATTECRANFDICDQPSSVSSATSLVYSSFIIVFCAMVYLL